MDISLHIANTLRYQRKIKKWSLSYAALQTGVSKAMLGQIERQESSPSVAILWKIATGFNIPFSELVQAPCSPLPAVPLAPASRMQAAAIFPYDDKLRMDYLSLHLAPEASSESSPHEQGVIEHVVVLSGVLTLRIEENWLTLMPGQGHRFLADRTHGYYNRGSVDLHFHSIIHYP